MNYFIFLIALSVRVSGNNYYENLNLEYNQHLIKYETQNLYGNENLYTFENDMKNAIKVVNCDGLGENSCPNTKQPLCATNGQHYLYFQNPCQLEIRNYEELIQGRQEYFQCPLYLCQKQCPQCPDDHDPACAMELDTGKVVILKNSCEVDRRACLTNKVYRIVSRTKCSQQSTQSSHCPEFLCTRDYRPVCAKFNNELKEFSNNCELERARCFTNTNWQIVSMGPCYSSPDSKYTLSSICPHVCTLEYKPICAEFNKELREFGNNCELERTRCQTNDDWQFVHEGPCFPVPDNTVPQPPKCPDVCTHEYRPICAKFKNELREFGNNCELQRTRCQTNNDWQFVHEGPCYPVPNNTKPKCPDVCTLEYRPICAKFNNELREFGNSCALHRTRCQTNDDWQVVNIGPCPEDPNECPKFCTKELNPVCARYLTETREFSNICELRRAICETNVYWQLERIGPCLSESRPQECPEFCTEEFRPVCARYGYVIREFSNSCELQRTICETNIAWTIVNDGRCQEHQSPCENEEFEPICARFDFNVKTFRNLCELAEEIKITGNDWYILYNGKCQNLIQPTITWEPYFTTAMSVMPPSTTEISTSSVDEENFTSTTTPSAVVTTPESTTSSTETPTFLVYNKYFSSSLNTSSTLDTSSSLVTTETTTPEISNTTSVTTSPLTESTSSTDVVPITIPYATTTSYYGYFGGNYKKSLSSGYYGEPTDTGIQKSYDKRNGESSKYPRHDFIYSPANDQVFSPYNQPLTAYNPFLNFPGILTNQHLPDYSQFHPNNDAAIQNSPTHQSVPDYSSLQPSYPSIIYKNPLYNQAIYDSKPDQTNSSNGAQPPEIESQMSNNPSQFLAFLSHIFNKYGAEQQLTEQSDFPFNQPEICPSKTEDLQDFPYSAAEYQPSQIYPPFLPISFISLPMSSYNPAELPPIYPQGS